MNFIDIKMHGTTIKKSSKKICIQVSSKHIIQKYDWTAWKGLSGFRIVTLACCCERRIETSASTLQAIA